MQINLNNCFPEGVSGKRGPLPKQAELMHTALDPKEPKYCAYVGGIGSGKTLIGCITVLSWAVTHPGDYLVARQFMPELRDTTLKTFLEICPPELIAERRVAESIVRIRSVNGQTSNIFFRGLEEPDKLRSLNLSGFYIDEASQVTEAAFMLLQGRLRGPGLRKGILTTNPAGHDWIYMWFLRQDFLVDNEIKREFKLINAPSTENKHLPPGYVETMMATWSPERIKREIYGSFDAFEGMVYHEFRRDAHVIKPFKIPKNWTKVMGIDHGYRNPTAVLWAAVDFDENVYIYREFYEREWLVEEICKGKGPERGIVALTGREKISGAFIDPSVDAKRGGKGLNIWAEYLDYLPRHFPLAKANNKKEAGIERVKNYMKLDEKTGEPQLFIFDTCKNLIDELVQYRYKELKPAQVGKMNEKEEPYKVNDHAVDALRYLIMSRPEKPKKSLEGIHKTYTSEYYLQQHIKRIKQNLKKRDPWGDF